MNSRGFEGHGWRKSIRVFVRILFSLIILFAGQRPVAAQAGGPDGPQPILRGYTSRVLQFPANSLNFERESTVLIQSARGILWHASTADSAFLIIPRPLDWNGSSDIVLHLFFYPNTAASGSVQFFTRPRGYNPGEQLGATIVVDGPPVNVAAANLIHEQVITIPAALLANKDLWVIQISRKGALETYPDTVMLLSVSLNYNATDASLVSQEMPANALNFDRSNPYLTQYSTGIIWQATGQGGAFLSIPRPLNWSGQGDVSLHLFFYSTLAASGAVQFTVRPRAYNRGDIFGDGPPTTGEPVPVSKFTQVGEQIIHLPAATFGDHQQWMISIHRQGANETYASPVVLMAVSLTYTPGTASPDFFVLPANGLNFSRQAAVITQSYAGLTWENNYSSAAYLIVPRPSGWTGTGLVMLHLVFYVTSSTPGTVDFFLRPRGHDLGDEFIEERDTGDLNTQVSVSQNYQVQEQQIPIRQHELGTKALWVITIQREGYHDTYPDPLVLTSVGLTYYPNQVFLPAVRRGQ